MPDRRPAAATARRGQPRPDRTARPGAGPGGRTTPAGRGPAADRTVVGSVPLLARAAGAVLAVAGLLGVASALPTYLVVDGVVLRLATGPLGTLAVLLAPVVALAVGAVLAAGRVPKAGLAYAAVSGGLAAGRLLIELYRGQSSTTRPPVEVLAGERVLTSSVQTGPGWLLGVAALGLTVLAGVLACLAWGRTVMDDGGSLDPLRPVLAGAAVLVGVGAVLCLSLPAADLPDALVTDPATGLVTVVPAEGPPALLERPGLALAGGLLLAGALLLSAVLAPSLRPRLAAVGGLLAITVLLLTVGLGGLGDAVHSPDLDWTVPGAGLLLLALAAAGLTLLAWRWRPRAGARPGVDPAERFLRR